MMKSIIASMAVTGLMLVTQTASAEEAETMIGKIKSVDKDHIVLEVKEESHKLSVNSSTQVTLDGKKASLADLKEGFAARVTAKKGDDEQYVATRITASSKSTSPVNTLLAADEAKQFEGTVKQVENTKLQITNELKKEMSFQVASDATITLDGKRASLADLKAGFKVTVTATEKDDKWMASKIAAISKAE